MHHFKRLMLFVIVLALLAGTAWAVQINGHALGDIGDIVKEVTHGDLEIPKKSLMVVKDEVILDGGQRKNYVQPFVLTFKSNGSVDKSQALPAIYRQTPISSDGGIYSVRPAVSQRISDDKRSVMLHDFGDKNGFNASFIELQNNSGTLSSQTIGDAKSVSTASSTAIYGSAVMNAAGYGREIFVLASGFSEGNSSAIVALNFYAGGSYEKLDISRNVKVNFNPKYGSEIQVASIAAGDFDGDGQRNEFALLTNTKSIIQLYVFRIVYADGKLQLKMLGNADGYNVLTTKKNFGTTPIEQGCSEVIAGDFDGDGTDEIAAIYKDDTNDTASKNDKIVMGKVNTAIYKWDSQKGDFSTGKGDVSYNYYENHNWSGYQEWSTIAGLRAVAADLDGDGKDEIVTLIIGFYERYSWYRDYSGYTGAGSKDEYWYYPYLAVWSCQRGTITPVHDSNHIKGSGVQAGLLKDKASAKQLIGRHVWWYMYDYNYSQTGRTSNGGTPHPKYIYAPQVFSLAAGPFTGTMGTAKTVDDIAFSYGTSWSLVYLVKTNLKDNAFDGFADAKRVASSVKLDDQSIAVLDDRSMANYQNAGWMRTGLAAADFVGEGLELDSPVHVIRKNDNSYVAVLNAPPYHVDTLSSDGMSLSTQPTNFTFSDGGGGKMKIYYNQTTADETSRTVDFNLSSSTESIFSLGDLGNKIGKIAGYRNKFVVKLIAKAIGKKANSAIGFLEKFLDKVENTKNGTKNSTKKVIIADNIEAMTNDAILHYFADQHIWRYPVLTKPVPEWLEGDRLDTQEGDAPESADRYITFTLYDEPRKAMTNSIGDNSYQTLHEEGNFFSYHQSIENIEGYNPNGRLSDVVSWTFSDGTSAASEAAFTEAKENMTQTSTQISVSKITKVVSLIDSLMGGEKAGIKSFVPNAGSPETFTKNYSKAEKIGFELQARTGMVQNAGHTLEFVPYVAKEGTMTLGSAVKLNTNSTLWSNSLYTQLPDPSLVLPQKFVRSGNGFAANTNEKTATALRGVRFYVPDFTMYTDNRLLAGVSYKIRVPVYNASFVESGTFTARLSYASDNTAASPKTAIANTTATLRGWQNDRDNNKGWLEFDWTPEIPTGEYYFYVEIDPDNTLQEVHDARWGADGKIADYGGNNTGYTRFYVFRPEDKFFEADKTTVRASANGEGSGDSFELPGGGKLRLKFNDSYSTADMMNELTNWSNDVGYNVPMPVTCTVEYTGEDIFPYVRIIGFTTKKGADMSNLTDNDIAECFALHDTALIPGKNSEFTFMLSAETLDKAPEAAFAVTTSYADYYDDGYDVSGGDFEDYELENYDESLYVQEEITKTYHLKSSNPVFWLVESITKDGEEEYLDAEFEPEGFVESADLVVSTIPGWTEKGTYTLKVQISEDGENWVDADTVEFVAESSSSGNNSGNTGGNTTNEDNSGGTGGDTPINDIASDIKAAGGGCNLGLGMVSLLGLALFLRKRR